MQKRIEFLDGLRVFAFVSVLIGHKFYGQLELASANLNIHATIRFVIDLIRPLAWSGGAGVVVFFLVSGYIISHVLQTENTPTFLIKRIFRIYPLYMFAVLAEVGMSHWVAQTPFPPYPVLLQRLLLIGDLFSTPYGLGGVEWTLRLEMSFYLLMGSLRLLNLLKDTTRLPLIYFILTLAIQLAPAFPRTGAFTDGYLTLFFPFLFIGSSIYLMEHQLASRPACWGYVLYAIVSTLALWPGLNPANKDTHFQILGFLLFASVWGLRNHIKASSTVTLLSNLTYSVYLFHNWIWAYLLAAVSRWHAIRPEHRWMAILMLLFLICLATHYTVEKWGVKLGANIIKKLKRLRDAGHFQKVA
ncbi:MULTISPECIES: acyltransferase family protein [Herbaspirillum]|uniref:Acyltransferase 3 domain-containing protein n=1 Tax=Herbaspirillum frisingense GSF30 TaxID=864073 RepID=A0AAI9ID93_9BURK|nr:MULTISPECIES: acyltransferase [Herbaspirillum]EOA03975.1 hypothetical protein HFRIS_014889 [Herbaspirillum frisingense GSF30]MCI1014916.1 acyltransferase [Herbaspirillum sp. C7C2]UIN20018.1 acyltransferase [Herbaspirillum frisingense]